MAKVVIVDDSPIVTKMLDACLSGRGYEVCAFNSPFGVSSKLRGLNPDVVLMDLGLPGLSGDQLLNIFKGLEGVKFRTIIVSSAGEAELQALVSKGVAHDYFVKGAPIELLVEKVVRQVTLANM